MPSTVDTFLQTAAKHPDKVALRTRTESGWTEITWRQYRDAVRRVGRALLALGVEPGGTVAIASANRPEWLYAALGAMAVGAAPAGIYPTSTPDQARYVVAHAGAKVVFVDGDDQLAKLDRHADAVVVRFDGKGDGERVLSWAQLLARADGAPEAALDERIAAIRGSDTASLIYTSGTTGNPKAVRLTHDNLAYTQRTYEAALPPRAPDEHFVSYLPLSHIAEQNLTLYGQIYAGYTVSFCPKLELLGTVLQEVRPTVFFGVPRVWERIEHRMKEAAKGRPWAVRKLGEWARRVGLEAGRARIEGRRLPLSYPLAKRLVFDRVRGALGLDRARLVVSGAAKLSMSTLEYFLSLDLPIHEVYGMSENCAMTSINLPGAIKLGTVGRPVNGVEVRIAEDGEILVRGAHVFAGYLRDDAATAEAIDGDGWLHTGDVGELDADGFLRITDRKKELIKTSGGKFVAPAHVEGLLAGIPGVGQAVLIGEGRKTCVALIALDPEAAPKVAESLGIAERSLPDLAQSPAFRRHLDEGVAAVNAKLASYESVKAFHVLPTAFSVETGELTPTLKLKRKVVAERWAAPIEALYASLG
jgi:long-subunit acyl-CoA synthetase (AMP-forming)